MIRILTLGSSNSNFNSPFFNSKLFTKNIIIKKNIKEKIPKNSIDKNNSNLNTHTQSPYIQASALIDSGASENFMDFYFAASNGIEITSLAAPQKIETVDGTAPTSGLIKHKTAKLEVSTELNHKEFIEFYLIKSAHSPVILGYPWLAKHNPEINWNSANIKFNSDYCQNCCTNPQHVNVTFRSPNSENKEEIDSDSDTSLVTSSDSEFLSAPESIGLDSEPRYQNLPSKLNPTITPNKTNIKLTLEPRCNDHMLNNKTTSISESTPNNYNLQKEPNQKSIQKNNLISKNPTEPIQNENRTKYLLLNSPAPSNNLTPEPSKSIIPYSGTHKNPIITASYTEIKNKQLSKSQPIKNEDTNIEKISEIKLPTEYTDFVNVFNKKLSNTLPPHRNYDCKIDLQKNAEPPWGPIYSLSMPELETLRKYIDDNLANGFIRPSTSPAGAPVMFIKKKDESLRLCVDYRKLNNLTIKNRHPLPRIDDSFDQLKGAKIFTKLDLQNAYHLLRIKRGDEWKTAFRCKYGHFEYCVMPFGLTNAPATFQHLINDTLRDVLDRYAIAYLDDILIFSPDQQSHTEHVKSVLNKLKQAGLYCKLEKCEFNKKQVQFLGHTISEKGIQTDELKIECVKTWKIPTTVKEIQSFLGFANYYRRFILNYSTICEPLNNLLRKNTKFVWSVKVDEAFNKIKQLLISAPILIHPNQDLPFIVETDASDYGLGCVLSQANNEGFWQPCAYYSRSFSPAERNYDIFDKEMLAIVTALKVWRHYLEGAKHPFIVYTDHKNIEYFKSAKSLNRRHARWALMFTQFEFTITYRPGLQCTKPDALSRQSNLKNTEHKNNSIINSSHFINVIIIPENLLTAEIRKELENDELAIKLKEKLKTKNKLSRLEQKYLKIRNNLIVWKERIYVPKNMQLKLLNNFHDTKPAGHFGNKKTYELISRDYWFPKLNETVKNYVKTCDICNRSKIPRHKKHGLLQPITVAEKPWSSITMDFITDLPPSEGKTAIFVVVDRFTKMSHFIGIDKLPNAEKTAKIFIKHIFKHHGVPENIISDRGTQFTSKFWTRLFKLLGVEIKLSSAFHPETDGQTERTNQTLEQYIRCFTSYQQDDWFSLLDLAEFSYNNSVHSATKQTPFYSLYGYHPQFNPKLPTQTKVPTAEERITILHDIHKDLISNLKFANKQQKKHTDKKRMQSPNYKTDDLVWLINKNIKTNRPSAKFDFKRLGPFKIDKKINDVAFKLKMPESIKIHPVFHVSLLEPYNPNTFENRTQEPPPPIIVEGEQEFEINKILDSKLNRNKLLYLVDWKGYPPSERTWEPAENLIKTHQAEQFHIEYPNKPKCI